MSEHTPGPWQAGAYLCLTNLDIDGKIDAANARLVAAAPDLLAALKQLYAEIEPRLKGVGVYEPLGMAAKRALDAIAEAEGKS